MRSFNDPATTATHKQRLQHRLNGIYQVINEIAPDILCITEGPAGESGIDQFVSGLPGYSAIKRLAGDSYHQKGQQWIWFLVTNALTPAASLLPIQVWHEYTELASPVSEHKSRWPVYWWGQIDTAYHAHYRHPQVLVLMLNGIRLELIGGHFKSKLTTTGSFASSDPERRRAYIEATVQNRIKLGTEAQNVRYYIDQRFRQEPSPAILVMGDLNDGPGKELIERQFMFFDLLNNLQGDVFEAGKFLNHALFDYPGDLNWTVYFKDAIDPGRNPYILLDHIMFTQALVRGQIPLQIQPHAGKVEHEIFDRANAMLGSGLRLSDHRPVSCVISQVS